MKKVEKSNEIKRRLPVFRLACLCAVATLAVTASFAKYVSTNDAGVSAGVSPFAASVRVDQSQPLFVFDNAEYYYNGQEDTTMNTPQNTPFTVSNSKTDEGGTVATSEVDLEYSLVFYVPTTFFNSAAIQILEKSDGSLIYDKAVTPLFVLSDFEKTSFTTNSKKYGGILTTEETYTKSGESNLFLSGSGESQVSVRVESVRHGAVYEYTFPTREGKNKLPVLALQVKEENFEFYKLTISRPRFFLSGGAKVEHNYAFRLVPTKAMTPPTDSTETPADGSFSVKWTDCLAGNMVTQEKLRVKTSGWSVRYDASTQTVTLIDDKKVSHTVLVGASAIVDDQNHGASSGKSYPCRINAHFEQASNLS